MIDLTEQQFFDYIRCPALYDMKYNHKLLINKPVTIKDILQKATLAYYNLTIQRVQNNESPVSFKTLTKKYESFYKPYKDIFNKDDYIEGLMALQNFFDYMESIKLAVFNINSAYKITYKDVSLQGILNPIAVNQKKQLEFLIMNYSNRTPDTLEGELKLKYTIDQLAFNKSNRDLQVNGLRIHTIKKVKKVKKVKKDTDLLIAKNDNDFNRFYSTLYNVGQAIQNNIYFVRDDHMCSSCLYRHQCKAWKRSEN